MGTPLDLSLRRGPTGAPAVLVLGGSRADLPLLGAVLLPSPDLLLSLWLDGSGEAVLRLTTPGLPPGTRLWLQDVVLDAAAAQGVVFSNALLATVP